MSPSGLCYIVHDNWVAPGFCDRRLDCALRGCTHNSHYHLLCLCMSRTMTRRWLCQIDLLTVKQIVLEQQLQNGLAPTDTARQHTNSLYFSLYFHCFEFKFFRTFFRHDFQHDLSHKKRPKFMISGMNSWKIWSWFRVYQEVSRQRMLIYEFRYEFIFTNVNSFMNSYVETFFNEFICELIYELIYVNTQWFHIWIIYEWT